MPTAVRNADAHSGRADVSQVKTGGATLGKVGGVSRPRPPTATGQGLAATRRTGGADPQASARPCKRICKREASRRAEAGKTTVMPGEGQPTFAVVGSAA